MQECSDYMTIDSAIGLNDKNYIISSEQAQAILDMRLNKLTNLEQEVIIKDYNEAIESIKKNLKILTTEKDYERIYDLQQKKINFLKIDLIIDNEDKLLQIMKL